MGRDIEHFLAKLRETRSIPDAESAVKEIMILGRDAVEAIPDIIGKSATLNHLFLTYDENQLLEQCGPAAATIALICHVRALGQQKNPMDLFCAAGRIKYLVKEQGAIGNSVLPTLQQCIRALSVARVEKLYHLGDASQLNGLKEGDRQGVEARASELLDKVLGSAISTLQEAINHIQENTDVGVPRVSASTIQEFTERAFRQRASIAIHLSDLGCVTDALVEAVRAELPELTLGTIVSKITDAMLIQCPSCGYFTQEAVAHLVLAAKGAYKPGVIADSVVATGPNVASLGQGECPRCKGSFSILTIDLRVLGIIRKTWWQFWK